MKPRIDNAQSVSHERTGAPSPSTSQPYKGGRRLILRFSAGPDPELQQIEFRYSHDSSGIKLDLDATAEGAGFSWGRAAKAFALLFLDYSGWECGDASFVFPGRHERHLATTVGDDRYKEAGLIKRVFLELRNDGQKEHFGEVFKIGFYRKTTRPCIIKIRSRFMPSECVEIFWTERGNGKLIDRRAIRELANRIRRAEGLMAEEQEGTAERPLVRGEGKLSDPSMLKPPPLRDEVAELSSEDLAFKNAWLCDFLAWLYRSEDLDLLEINGHRFPAVGWTVHGGISTSANSILEFVNPEWLQSSDKGYAIYDSSAVQRRLSSRKTVENKPTFCLRHYDRKREKVVGGLIGKYYDAIATCDALRDELEQAYSEMRASERTRSENAFRRFLARLPLREHLMNYCREQGVSPLLTGAGRSAALAVATVTAFRVKTQNRDQYQAFFAKRSQDVANDPGAFHVVPSGMFQPTKDWRLPLEAGECEDEWDLRPHLYRESLEEVFDYSEKELIGMTGREVQGAFGREFFNKPLQTVPTDGFDPECLTTGIVVSLLNLRLEICTLMLIKDPIWYDRHSEGTDGCRRFKLSQLEFGQQLDGTSTGDRFYWLLDLWTNGHLFSDTEIFSQIPDFSPSTITVPGAAALAFGLKAFRNRLPLRLTSRP